MEATERIHALLDRYRSKTITATEIDELLIWMSGLTNEQSARLAELHGELWELAKAGRLHSSADKVNWNKMLREVMETDNRREGKAVRQLWLRISSIAAAAIVVIMIGTYWFNINSKKTATLAVSVPKTIQPEEVFPNLNHTILTLPDGRKIKLDSAINGQLPGSSKAVKVQDGEIAYAKVETASEPEYHTISVPRGGRPYKILLQDGSSVWLNAASSLRYPVFFNGKHRMVELTGEGYFNIERKIEKTVAASDAQNTGMKRNIPFVVKLPQMDIEVLGTRFNIMAYDDENSIETTLLHGSVKIIAGKEEKVLAPGWQAQLSKQSKLSVARANTELATAWVGGYFQFDKADIASILRQVGRWYDLEIEYRGKVPHDLFSGKIERSLPLSGILKLLGTGQIKLEMNGKKLIVL